MASDRVQEWLEDRIQSEWDSGKKYSASRALNDFMLRFNIKSLGRQKKREYIALIQRIKERIKKRKTRKIQILKTASQDLNVPERMVSRWGRVGLLRLDSKKSVEAVVRLVRERDYFLGQRMRPEDIPSNDSEPLWGK